MVTSRSAIFRKRSKSVTEQPQWPVRRCRVASSAAACASLRRNRCTASTAFGIMAARRQTCGCGCGAESMPSATLPDRRRSARPPRAAAGRERAERAAESRRRACTRAHARAHAHACGDPASVEKYSRAEIHISRTVRQEGHISSSCFLRFRVQPGRAKSKTESRLLQVISLELLMTFERFPDFRFPRQPE